MTGDSRLFPPRPQWEAKGYRPDEYSRWLLGDWRPIEDLWAELGVDPSRPQPPEIELEDWLFRHLRRPPNAALPTPATSTATCSNPATPPAPTGACAALNRPVTAFRSLAPTFLPA